MYDVKDLHGKDVIVELNGVVSIPCFIAKIDPRIGATLMGRYTYDKAVCIEPVSSEMINRLRGGYLCLHSFLNNVSFELKQCPFEKITSLDEANERDKTMEVEYV